MCFSAPASFIAGGSLSVMGRVTVKQTKHKSEVPFAIIPLLFGIQQFIEGFVWISFGMPVLHAIATYGFVFFAYVVWPIWVPYSIMLLEHDKLRRKILVFFFAAGLAVGFAQLYYMFTEPVSSYISSNSIVYVVPNAFGFFMMFLYLMATCLSCAFSSHRMVKLFGFALFVSLAIAYHFYTVSCFSVWCFFAALLSLIIFIQFRLKADVTGKVPAHG